jgi:4-phytase / acid phosphatase
MGACAAVSAIGRSGAGERDFVEDLKSGVVMTRINALFALSVGLVCAASAARGDDFAPPGDLERVVILSRHGVRSPTMDADGLQQWRRPDTPKWPDFGVQHPADLTLKGARLMQGMGAYYRHRWTSLFKPDACPSNVSIWADRDERTLMTAQALVSGLAGGACRATIGEADTLIDPLFHPTSALEDCKFKPTEAPRDSKDDVGAVQGVVDCCSKRFARSFLNGMPVNFRTSRRRAPPMR